MEGDDAALGDGHSFAGLQVAARTGNLVAHGEIAETGDLHRVALFKVLGDEFEEGFDDELRMRTIKVRNLRDQRFGNARLIERANVLIVLFFFLIFHMSSFLSMEIS